MKGERQTVQFASSYKRETMIIVAWFCFFREGRDRKDISLNEKVASDPNFCCCRVS